MGAAPIEKKGSILDILGAKGTVEEVHLMLQQVIDRAHDAEIDAVKQNEIVVNRILDRVGVLIIRLEAIIAKFDGLTIKFGK